MIIKTPSLLETIGFGATRTRAFVCFDSPGPNVSMQTGRFFKRNGLSAPCTIGYVHLLTSAAHVCRSRLPLTSAAHVCRSRLPLTSAAHVCSRLLTSYVFWL